MSDGEDGSDDDDGTEDQAEDDVDDVDYHPGYQQYLYSSLQYSI